MNRTSLFGTLLAVFCAATVVTGQDLREKSVKRAKNYLLKNSIVYDADRNVYKSGRGNVLHLFVMEDGQLLFSGFPTTATDRDMFQIHLLKQSTNLDNYVFVALGSYEPSLNIEGAESESSSGVTEAIKVDVFDFPTVGPFTGEVQFILERAGATLIDRTVKISKTIHASIGSGFIFSTLKNPTNIRKVALPESDSTLLADFPKGNATLSLMATLYPWGKNSLMLPRRSFADRTGIVIGTSIASGTKNFKNVLLGLQYDFAFGGSFVLGLDIADRQRIMGVKYRDFEFGETRFSGTLDDKLYKSIGASVFFGVQVDSRIFSKLFVTE
jgi:hypothetical protein